MANRRLLWLEDETQAIPYERALMASHGWSISVANAVDEAKQRLSEERFDLVILDLILPADDRERRTGFVSSNNGVAFTRHIRNLEGGTTTAPRATPTDVPVLVLTAVGLPETRSLVERALGTRYAYVNKPPREGEFMDRIDWLTQDDLRNSATRLQIEAKRNGGA